jgi:DNA polymerase I
VACCLATERGVEVCAPVHDALLICAPLERLEPDVAATRAAMAEASRMVLSGFEIGTDAKLVAYPDRYMDGRGQVMWDRVCGLVDAEEQKKRKMALCA